MSSFNGIYTVRSGLDAARRAMDVVGQNVANANTAGYTRQEVSFVSAEPSHVIKSPGRGISESLVLRYRDQFLDKQYRARAGAQGYYSALNSQLGQVEAAMGDLSDGSIRNTMDAFFSAWDTLAQHPNDPAFKSGVVRAAGDFINQARSIFNDLAGMRSSIDTTVQAKVDEVNSAAQQIVELNKAIMAAQTKGQPPNDLLDQRDRLLDSLAKLAGTTSVEHSDGSVTVHLGSLPIVDKTVAWSIKGTTAVEPDQDADPALTSYQQNLTSFTFDGTNNPALFSGGEIGGLLKVRDEAIPEYMKYLDTAVRSVATAVNGVHMRPDTAGNPLTAPVPIFTDATGALPLGSQWLDIVVNPAVVSDPSLVLAGDPGWDPVASTQTAPGASDGRRALDIARLQNQPLLTGAPVGTKVVAPGEYLRAITTSLGLDIQQAQRMSEGADMQASQVSQQRESVSGVSLDEEMTKMIQFQQTYNAAARVMTSMDELLDVIVNRLGSFGR
ncbi:MAG TPA: flagellar hook-associated protein FlgK [Symbiobacteriaceae bacterium]|jgi:flagellar hook-associated protein 1 FlgK|nr:flagellar hook-associated protein FlgK [Symbiobacteriaceae bacterium]